MTGMNCGPKEISVLIGAWLAHAALEYWLGKTQRTRAASVLELGGLMILAIVTFFYLKLKESRHVGSKGR